MSVDRFKSCPKMYFRTTTRSKKAIHHLVAELKFSGNLSLGDKPGVSQEGLHNAVWLWLEEMIDSKGHRHLEKILAPYLEKVDKDLDRDVAKAKKEAAAQGGGAAPEGFSKPKPTGKRPPKKSGTNGAPGQGTE